LVSITTTLPSKSAGECLAGVRVATPIWVM